MPPSSRASRPRSGPPRPPPPRWTRSPCPCRWRASRTPSTWSCPKLGGELPLLTPGAPEGPAVRRGPAHPRAGRPAAAGQRRTARRGPARPAAAPPRRRLRPRRRRRARLRPADAVPGPGRRRPADRAQPRQLRPARTPSSRRWACWPRYCRRSRARTWRRAPACRTYDRPAVGLCIEGARDRGGGPGPSAVRAPDVPFGPSDRDRAGRRAVTGTEAEPEEQRWS